MSDPGWHRHPGTNKIDWWDGEGWGNPPPDAVPKKNQNAANAFGLGLFSLLFLLIPLFGVRFFSPLTAAIGIGYGVATIATAEKYRHRGLALSLFGLMFCAISVIVVVDVVFR